MSLPALPFLAGKVALVTGASRGIGAATAEALAGAGARVVAAARSTKEIETLAERIGKGALARTLDVTDSKAVDACVDEIAKSCGRLDILVNNAGASERKTASQGDDEWWDRMLRANLTSAFYASRAALRHMGEGGRIVNIASVLAIFGTGESAGYTAAKHGMLGLTRSLADEVATRGISVNAVCPGWVDTGMARGGFERLAKISGTTPEVARARALSRVPTGRIVEPKEVASLVAFLCRPESRGIHGQAIRIDGGATPW